MGKRELLIVSLFIVAGVVAYQLSAPPASPAASRVTWRSFLDSVRPRSSRPRASVARTTTGTIPLTEAISEARISNIARLVATGEARNDISYELTVESAANDEAAAAVAVAGASLRHDQVGSVLALRWDAPRGTRTTAQLRIHLPARLAIRTDGGPGNGRVEIADLAGVRLDSIVGDVRLTSIAGEVTGFHRNGDLIATRIGGAQLSLVSSKAQFDDVRQNLTVSARNGRLTVQRPRGDVRLDLTNQQTAIEDAGGSVHVLGSGGALQVRSPQRDLTVDVRAMRVDITLDRSVPVAVLTADAPLHLALVGAPAIAIDANATDGGRVRITHPTLAPDRAGAETPFLHRIGAGAHTVALRNQRGDIVIAAVK